MVNKPQNPYPSIIRRLGKKVLPPDIYRKYIGRHEDGSLHHWNHLASNITPPEAIIDIGAYKGEFAIAARNANQNVAVYAFEPNPQSAQICRNNCDGFNILVEELAIAEGNGLVSFMINSAMSHIITVRDEESSAVVKVQSRSLDTWIAEHEVVPGLIKIDTEGAEAGILRGAKDCLEQYNPIILCEILSNDAGRVAMNSLPDNYLYYYIDENKGIEERAKITRDTWRNHNWLLIPSTKRSMLES